MLAVSNTLTILTDRVVKSDGCASQNRDSRLSTPARGAESLKRAVAIMRGAGTLMPLAWVSDWRAAGAGREEADERRRPRDDWRHCSPATARDRASALRRRRSRAERGGRRRAGAHCGQNARRGAVERAIAG